VLDGKRVTFLWSERENGRVTEVVAATPEYPIADPDRYDNSSGACMTDWMKGDPRLTPEGLFSLMLVTGFADRYWLEEALSQFGLLEQCEWARAMLKALRP
jgi:hypothetical protein